MTGSTIRVSFVDHLDRARALHRAHFVFDFSPLGEPIVMSARHRAVMLEKLAAGASVGVVLRAMFSDRLREVVEDPEVRERAREVWREAGVKAVQVTLGGIELDPSGWDAVLRDAAHWIARERLCGTSSATGARSATSPV